MKLRDYLDRHQLTESAFAEIVGVQASAVNRLIPKNGEPARRKPGFELMARIAAATSGAVMPNDFMDHLPELIEGFDLDDDVPLDAAGDPGSAAGRPPGSSGAPLRRAG